MDLNIIFKNASEVELVLMSAGVVVDRLIIRVDFSFDTVLLESIDKILKKNRIEKVSLNRVFMEPDLGNESSAYRIAQSVVEALKSH